MYGKAKETKQVKTRFHNITNRTAKYTPEELENLLKENQKAKFEKVKSEDQTNEIVEVVPVEVKEEIVKNDVLVFVPSFKHNF